jgi:hypothetical protein
MVDNWLGRRLIGLVTGEPQGCHFPSLLLVTAPLILSHASDIRRYLRFLRLLYQSFSFPSVAFARYSTPGFVCAEGVDGTRPNATIFGFCGYSDMQSESKQNEKNLQYTLLVNIFGRSFFLVGFGASGVDAPHDLEGSEKHLLLD